MSVSATVKSIQEIMRRDVGVDGDAQRVSQIVWLLFLKAFDAQEDANEKSTRDYCSLIPTRLRWRTWAQSTKDLSGDELIKFVDGDLFPSLKRLKGTSPQHRLIRMVFSETRNQMKSGTLLRRVIDKLDNDVDFNKAKKRHVLGDMYEQILRDLRSAGNAGEFYTPRAVTEFMVECIGPRLGEIVLDPACGTGGFLTAALEYMRRGRLKDTDERQLAESIHGVEKKPLPHFLCVTNMLLHGVDAPLNIRRGNILAAPYMKSPIAAPVDVVVTNPPFGGFEEDNVVRNFPPAFQTQRASELFVARIIEVLRDGGRCGIVLPDGLLFGEGVKMRIRRSLLERCDLHTIVRLPSGVFAPYTDIKTNLLFFTKGRPTTRIWFYEHPCPSGLKRYTKTRPIDISEFVTERAWWSDRKETEFAWHVDIADITARNYDIDFKNPRINQYSNGNPVELLAEYQKAQVALDDARERLFRELKSMFVGDV